MRERTTIEELFESNRRFVLNDCATPFQADKKPRRHLVVVACMDTRLITMLTAALGLENGDANIIKTAGAEVNEPYGAVMRSLLVSVYELDATDILVIAHTECGAHHMNAAGLTALMRQAGIGEQAFEAVTANGIDLTDWLEGFGDMEQSVKNSVATIRNHPLIPEHVDIHGCIIDTKTGELILVDSQ